MLPALYIIEQEIFIRCDGSDFDTSRLQRLLANDFPSIWRHRLIKSTDNFAE